MKLRARFMNFTFVVPLAASLAAATNSKIEFNRDIRPILSDNCFTCHGQDSGSRKARLRLDDRDIALKGGKSGLPAIVPGKPGESEVLLRIRSHDEDEVMPPPDKKERLSPEAVAKLERWIAEGAVYQPHWAFIPPARPALPPAANPDAHAIDRLVAAKLRPAGLKPSPEAAPETLVRRLHLDLVGLPPAPTEVDAFVASYSRNGDDAWSALVDRLLASPHYGEKWARHWLDAARYADSDGYEKDLPRQQWAWRDWVIRALNTDQPYDRFIIEQVAGDLLVTPQTGLATAQDLRVATGYLRNSMVNEEGAILAEQFRMEGMFDRMDAIGKGVLGVTLQCAQCHTHKFDPITHEDYYRLFASLNNTYEATSAVYAAEKLATIERIQREIAAAEARLKAEHPDWTSQLAAWTEAQRSGALHWDIAKPTEAEWKGGLAHPEVLADGSVLTRGFRPLNGDLIFTAEPALSGVTGLRLEALTHGDLIFGGPGRSVDGLFAVSELIIEVQPPGETKWKKLELAQATSDFDAAERPLPKIFRKDENDKRVLGGAAFLIDGNEETAWGPDRGLGRRNAPSEVVVRFSEPLAFPEGTKLRGTLRFKHGGNDGHGRTSHLLGRFRVALTTHAEPHSSPIPTAARLALEAPASDGVSSEQQAILFAAWRAGVTEFAAANAAIETLWAQFPERDTTVLNLAERLPEETRRSFVLDRGAWDKPKHAVTPGMPGFLHATAATNELPRLAFARWLVDRQSPTTARVAVNRVWQALFGEGLIETPEDFGVRATEPVNRDLLDWLAVEFMERGWSQKQLIRAIVLSSTYRQSSRLTPELATRDPKNQLLARGPRFRVDAEIVRDIALSTSGLLTDQIGGPSIFPPMPESVFATSFIPVTFWNVATGAERYRRSLYVFRRRSMPDPVMSSFDAPNGDAACVARPRSNTPLAALASLNETVFVEAAQALAQRVLREGGATDRDRIVHGFRVCTARRPKPAEVDEFLALLRKARMQIADGWLSAQELAFGAGATLPQLPANTTPADAAAWTVAARVLLNLDETLTKN